MIEKLIFVQVYLALSEHVGSSHSRDFRRQLLYLAENWPLPSTKHKLNKLPFQFFKIAVEIVHFYLPRDNCELNFSRTRKLASSNALSESQ